MLKKNSANKVLRAIGVVAIYFVVALAFAAVQIGGAMVQGDATSFRYVGF